VTSLSDTGLVFLEGREGLCVICGRCFPETRLPGPYPAYLYPSQRNNDTPGNALHQLMCDDFWTGGGGRGRGPLGAQGGSPDLEASFSFDLGSCGGFLPLAGLQLPA